VCERESKAGEKERERDKEKEKKEGRWEVTTERMGK
tara:strand:+ start:482 stop:589 length:108 start_codon:yes stop_codon:yes gene_type:complete